MQKRDKLDPSVRKCLFLGYKTNTTGYVLYDLQTHNVLISRHVFFYENIFPYQSSTSKLVENITTNEDDYASFDDTFFASHIPSPPLLITFLLLVLPHLKLIPFIILWQNQHPL